MDKFCSLLYGTYLRQKTRSKENLLKQVLREFFAWKTSAPKNQLYYAVPTGVRTNSFKGHFFAPKNWLFKKNLSPCLGTKLAKPECFCQDFKTIYFKQLPNNIYRSEVIDDAKIIDFFDRTSVGQLYVKFAERESPLIGTCSTGPSILRFVCKSNKL